MPSRSKKQRNFMILVEKCKRHGECPSKSISEAAKSMTYKELSDFIDTDVSELPEKVKKRSEEILKILKKTCQ